MGEARWWRRAVVVIPGDRVYVAALQRLLELESLGAGVLELGRAARGVRDAEREIAASFGDSAEAWDYLRELRQVAASIVSWRLGKAA